MTHQDGTLRPAAPQAQVGSESPGGGNAHRRPAVLSTADIVNREGKRNPARDPFVCATSSCWTRTGNSLSLAEAPAQ